MVTLLLIVIYIAFIGLGIPDSLFGTAWPAIYTEYGLPISLGGVITTVTFIGTTISSLLSARLIRKFGTARLTAGCTLLTALALLGFSLSHSFAILFILAIPLGLGAGSIDTALNNYVASHYNASQMSFLHCFYGIGVTVSPFILAIVFRNGTDWRRGYGIATMIQFAIAAVVIFSLPLWNKVREKNENSESDIKSLSIIEASKIRGVKVMWLLFLCTCSIELTVGAWSSTFLVESRGATEEIAARTITFYYLGMTLGRFLSGILARKIHSRKIISIGSVVLGIALLTLIITNNSYLAIAALFLIGLGNGPMFPNLNYLTPEQFGEERSAALIGAQMAVANISIVIAPLLFGFLGQALGMDVFGWFLLFFYVFLVIGVILNRRQFKKSVPGNSKYQRVEEKTKGTQKKHRIRKGILIFIMVILIYDLLWFAGMHISFNGYHLPEGAQVVLRPNIGHFSGCSCGNYTSIEMVYKIPEERIAEVEFGNIKNGFNVEPFNIQTTNIHYTGIEGRCGYVYNPNYPERYEAYTENDGNVYVHVDRVVYHGGYDENPLTIPLLLFDFI